jgi:ABC-type lipoprotein export system ATPase subunit
MGKIMATIALHEIHKVYDLGEMSVEALCGVSVQIDRGEFVTLIGPSGSGKSTLMNTLGCLDRPTRGSYLLDGQEVASMSRERRADLRNKKFGFIFQNFNLLSRCSAVENVELPLVYAGRLFGRQRRQRAIEVLDRVGLADRKDHQPSQLSGGQQQRVAIARALVNEPGIIMADEPTGNLDSKTSKEILEIFHQLNEKNHITVIMVTHDADVARHAKRLMVIRDGRIVKDTNDSAEALAALHT